jgi:xylulokinase
MGDPLLIGMDLGTTNGKVACYDLSGCCYAEAKHGYSTRFPQQGWAEQDPKDWIDALGLGLQEVAFELGQRVEDVVGLSLSAFGPGIVLVDKDGYPLAPCPTWQDVRCFPYGERLLNAVGPNWIGHGAPLAAFPAKLLWVKDEFPQIQARAAFVTPIKGFLLHWLTGKVVTDPSSGPGAMNWWLPAIEYVGWDVNQLPEILGFTDMVGGLRRSIAQNVGLKAGLPVFTGLNDGASATLGSGAVRLGDCVITIATSGVVRVLLPDRVDPEIVLKHFLFTWPYVESLWVGGGFTYSAASSLQWLADQFGIPRDPVSYSALLAEAESVPIGSRGILFLPYIAGRGTPNPDPDLRGSFLHLSIDHGQAEMVRSVLEGVAFALREIFDAFTNLGFVIRRILVTGGGAQSALWRQIIVDVLNQRASRAEGDSTLGNAMVVAVGQGYYQDFSSAADRMVTQHPSDKSNTDAFTHYERLYRIFTENREAVSNTPRFKIRGGI